MAKVTLNPQVEAKAEPKAESLADPKADPKADFRVVTDSRGRKLKVKRPELLAEFRFTEAAGPEASANTTWMGMAMPLIYLAELDGELVIPPRTKKEIDAAIVVLGREGYMALVGAISDLVEAEAEREKASVKNS